jgi:hypothetical protein
LLGTVEQKTWSGVWFESLSKLGRGMVLGFGIVLERVALCLVEHGALDHTIDDIDRKRFEHPSTPGHELTAADGGVATTRFDMTPLGRSFKRALVKLARLMQFDTEESDRATVGVVSLDNMMDMHLLQVIPIGPEAAKHQLELVFVWDFAMKDMLDLEMDGYVDAKLGISKLCPYEGSTASILAGHDLLDTD